MEDDAYQLKCILGLHCQTISYFCKCISMIYSQWENGDREWIRIHLQAISIVYYHVFMLLFVEIVYLYFSCFTLVKRLPAWVMTNNSWMLNLGYIQISRMSSQYKDVALWYKGSHYEYKTAAQTSRLYYRVSNTWKGHLYIEMQLRCFHQLTLQVFVCAKNPVLFIHPAAFRGLLVLERLDLKTPIYISCQLCSISGIP